MNFKELLTLPVEKSDRDANALLVRYTSLLPFGDFDAGWYLALQDVPRIEIKYLKDFCYDGRRTWTLGYVEFDGTVVMMFNKAGREGDDHYDAAHFDKEKVVEMTTYLIGLIEEPSDFKVASLEDDAQLFEEFYGDSIHTPFERY